MTNTPSPAQEFAALQKVTPAQALAYLQRRNKTTETYGWQDLWQQEHASQFTISRLTRADLLQSLQDQITKSVNGELSRRDFLRDAKKALADAGWWGEKEVIDPATGEILKTTFDPSRLKLIFDTNTSMAYAAGQWERIERTKRSHPYVRYITLIDGRERPAHRAWNNVTLPVDDAFWRTHFPPNGWRCRCRAVAVSQSDYDRGRTPTGDPMKKTAPDVIMRDWLDKRSGQVRSIPAGIDPGFGYNPGMARASAQAAMVKDKLMKLDAPIGAAMWAQLKPVLALEARVAAFSEWANVIRATGRTTGDYQVIDAIDSALLAKMQPLGVTPASAEIVVRDEDVWHTFRDTKSSALPWDWYLRLPAHIQTARAVILDKTVAGEPALLYVFDIPGKDSGKMVLKLDYTVTVKGDDGFKRKKPLNVLRTGSLVDVASMNQPAFTVLSGAL